MTQIAQQRADRIAAFRVELAELEREQVLALSAEQRGRVEAHLEAVLVGLARVHGVDLSEAAKRVSWGMRLASLLGGIAFFAAMVSWGANYEPWLREVRLLPPVSPRSR